MALPLIAIPVICLGSCGVIGALSKSVYEYCDSPKYFESYLDRNPNVKQNIEKLINKYTSKRNVRIDIKAFYGALWILFNKPEKTRRLKGDYSIAYMIKEYLKNPNDENKNNLLKKMGQYNKSGSLLKKEVYGIPIISLLMVLLDLSRTLHKDKKTFSIKLQYNDSFIIMGLYSNNLYEKLIY